MLAEAVPCRGLVLAGGFSRRMGRDKAALRGPDGQTYLEIACAALKPFCYNVHVSVRPDQTSDPLRARFPLIVDEGESIGPLGGLLAAFHHHPDAAWLVVPCDLPRITTEALRPLLTRRAPHLLATAHRSAQDQRPEPLCAIYEPGIIPLLEAARQNGRTSLRDLLLAQHARVRLLPPPQEDVLDHANSEKLEELP